MGNTQFYRSVRDNPDQITWKDVFSEFGRKHTREEAEYAFLAGTAMDQTTEANMLQKWRKPWLFWRIFLALLALAGINQVLIGMGESLTGNVNQGNWVVFQLLSQLVVPVALLCFFWELNIPRNISLAELAICVVAGGILSFFVTNLLSLVFPYDLPAYQGGPFREEPAKLAASLLLMLFFAKKRNKKIYGLTGLVIGAAVGTGFTIFESISYVLNYGGTEIALVRMVGALGGSSHALMTATYMAAVGLHVKGSSSGEKRLLEGNTFLNRDFAITFLGIVGIHMIWNSGMLPMIFAMLGLQVYGTSLSVVIAQSVIVIPVMWGLMLWITRKCLRQAVLSGRYPAVNDRQDRDNIFADKKRKRKDAGHAESACVTCIRGADRGKRQYLHLDQHSPAQAALTIGCLPDAGSHAMTLSRAPGVSRRHCSIRLTPRGCVVKDLGSSYGTYLETGEKLLPGAERLLERGGTIYLGSRDTALRIDVK